MGLGGYGGGGGLGPGDRCWGAFETDQVWFGGTVITASRRRCWGAFESDQVWFGGTIIAASRRDGTLRVVWDDGQSTMAHRADVHARCGADTLSALAANAAWVAEPCPRARAFVSAHL